MSEIINGARTSFGRRVAEPKAASNVPDSVIKTMVVPLIYSDMAAAGDSANDETVQLLPAYSFILSCHTFIKTAFLSGTDLDIGLAQKDGTPINAVGLDDSILTAALTANTWIVNDGALVGASVGANAAQVYFTANGAYTAGQGKVVIRYMEADLIDAV